MTPSDARKVLEAYSKWRRLPFDTDIEGPDTDELDEAIDVAISVLPEGLL